VSSGILSWPLVSVGVSALMMRVLFM
jgi:hypothetical protein